ncbi:uncharacterized protein JCM6883_001714 [Sporobolomyces salmoneus]|uniref:uncharacterized protein n=1 Tax=Sporobolomyces salmoneus TaxID=183962 RepID=UPI003176B4DE
MAEYSDGPPPSKASLLKWWKLFTSKDKSKQSSSSSQQQLSHSAPSDGRRVFPPPGSPSYIPPGRGLERGKDGNGRVFGVSLEQSLQYASVAISMVGQDGKQYVYGYVPIVVAKCGMMLKETATQTEGIFRVSGSNKRINQLQIVFDEPPRYGKDFDWTGYSVHDAASVLRRYLNSLPEPVIPAGLYLDFTAVLQRPQPITDSISAYRHLISLLPPASRYLLLYLLDFLSVFARCSTKNLMTASNLAVVFQPGLVSSRRDGTNSALLGFPGFVEGKLPPSASASGRGGAGGAGRGKEGAEEQAGEHGRGKEVLEFLIEQQGHFMLDLQAPVDAERQKNKGIEPNSTPIPTTTTTTTKTLSSSTNLPEKETVVATGIKGSTDLTRRGSDKSIERRRLRKSTDAAGKEGAGGKVKRSRTWGSSSKRRARENSPASSPQPPTITSFASPSPSTSYQNRPNVAAIPPSLSPPSHLEPSRHYAPSPPRTASPLLSSSAASSSTKKSRKSSTTTTTNPNDPMTTSPPPPPSVNPTIPSNRSPSIPPSSTSTTSSPNLSRPPTATTKPGTAGSDSPSSAGAVEFEGPRWATRVKKVATPETKR